mgnify:CR=1 FL=1
MRIDDEPSHNPFRSSYVDLPEIVENMLLYVSHHRLIQKQVPPMPSICGCDIESCTIRFWLGMELFYGIVSFFI